MKRAIWCALASVMVLGVSGEAMAGGTQAVRSKSFGIGLGGGTAVSGLSLKVPGDVAIQATLGFDYYGLGVGIDGLLEMPELAEVPGILGVAWNIGLGGTVLLWDTGRTFNNRSSGIGAAVSGIAGLEFNFDVLPTLPFDIVLEYRPSLFVLPGVGLDLIRFSGHIRVYF